VPGGVPGGGFEDDSVMECRVMGLLLFSCTKVLKRKKNLKIFLFCFDRVTIIIRA
jgi:hypothetical protein